MTSTSTILAPAHRSRSARYASRILRFLIAAVFLYAGVVKLFDPYNFATAIERYRIIGKPLSMILAFYLPWLEILTALCILAKRFTRAGSVLALILATIFVAANASAVARGLNITCGCFGAFSPAPVHHALWRSAGLLVLTVFQFVIDTRNVQRTP